MTLCASASVTLVQYKYLKVFGKARARCSRQRWALRQAQLDNVEDHQKL